MVKGTTLLGRLQAHGLVEAQQGWTQHIDIDHLANDSRKVGPGGLFIALKGEKFDGHQFIDKAVKNGAVAIVCEAMPELAQTRWPGIALATVEDGRKALAVLAAAYYGDPATDLDLLGVTGTNGKTTTTYLVHYLLEAMGTKAGLLGTIAYRFGGPPVPASHTTPDALDLQRMLREMVEAGCTACVMEVSSHALDQHRVYGMPFQVALFTNLTLDHLDYHGTFEQYREAKKKLFDGLPPSATALYNRDDPSGPAMVQDTAARVLSYGTSKAADLHLAVQRNTLAGLQMMLDGEERSYKLVGTFNAYNLAAAYGIVKALGHPKHEILDALAKAPPVPGRFEQIHFSDGTTAIVDYAHTPDALENVLKTIRATKDEQATLWCVFGCGGDRDPRKRRLMGKIAEQNADRNIVTSDNPRTEVPQAIMDEIARGMQAPERAQWHVDRRAAINAAAASAKPGDVVLVAGKGHEPYQILGTEKTPFDDRVVVREAFAQRGIPEADQRATTASE